VESTVLNDRMSLAYWSRARMRESTEAVLLKKFITNYTMKFRQEMSPSSCA
jgi:hypothetical protein